MIKYTLKCANDHRFDAWFASSQAYEKLSAARQLSCAVCGVEEVGKALMTPSIVSSKPREAKPVAKPAADGTAKDEALEIMRKLREHIERNSEYLGAQFAEEALKIHYEEAEPRSIYGEATEDEIKVLDQEGVKIYPLPVLPEDYN